MDDAIPVPSAEDCAGDGAPVVAVAGEDEAAGVVVDSPTGDDDDDDDDDDEEEDDFGVADVAFELGADVALFGSGLPGVGPAGGALLLVGSAALISASYTSSTHDPHWPQSLLSGSTKVNLPFLLMTKCWGLAIPNHPVNR